MPMLMETRLAIDPMGLYVPNIPWSSESYKGTGAYVCQFYKTNSFAGPEGVAKNARDADPGNLDQRNAEHYWYAQELRSDYSGWYAQNLGTNWGNTAFGDAAAVTGVFIHQAWKLIRWPSFVHYPTSPPSYQNFVWGITGALNPVRPNCGCGS